MSNANTDDRVTNALREKEADVTAGNAQGQNELLPCPFCGYLELIMNRYTAHMFVTCATCRTTFQIDNTSGIDAWKVSWNSRATPSVVAGVSSDASYSPKPASVEPSKAGNVETAALEIKEAASDSHPTRQNEPSDDPTVEAVVAKLRERSAKGIALYGTTITNSPLTRAEWLKHAQEEALDLANYLERLLSEHATKSSSVSYSSNPKSVSASGSAEGERE